MGTRGASIEALLDLRFALRVARLVSLVSRACVRYLFNHFSENHLAMGDFDLVVSVLRSTSDANNASDKSCRV